MYSSFGLSATRITQMRGPSTTATATAIASIPARPTCRIVFMTTPPRAEFAA